MSASLKSNCIPYKKRRLFGSVTATPKKKDEGIEFQRHKKIKLEFSIENLEDFGSDAVKTS